MCHYGGPTPKPHMAYANSHAIGGLSKGKLTNWKEKAKELDGQGKRVAYKDKQGKARWKGTSKLRKTEMLDGIYHRLRL